MQDKYLEINKIKCEFDKIANTKNTLQEKCENIEKENKVEIKEINEIRENMIQNHGQLYAKLFHEVEDLIKKKHVYTNDNDLNKSNSDQTTTKLKDDKELGEEAMVMSDLTENLVDKTTELNSNESNEFTKYNNTMKTLQSDMAKVNEINYDLKKQSKLLSIENEILQNKVNNSEKLMFQYYNECNKFKAEFNYMVNNKKDEMIIKENIDAQNNIKTNDTEESRIHVFSELEKLKKEIICLNVDKVKLEQIIVNLKNEFKVTIEFISKILTIK